MSHFMKTTQWGMTIFINSQPIAFSRSDCTNDGNNDFYALYSKIGGILGDNIPRSVADKNNGFNRLGMLLLNGIDTSLCKYKKIDIHNGIYLSKHKSLNIDDGTKHAIGSTRKKYFNKSDDWHLEFILQEGGWIICNVETKNERFIYSCICRPEINTHLLDGIDSEIRKDGIALFKKYSKFNDKKYPIWSQLLPTLK